MQIKLYVLCIISSLMLSSQVAYSQNEIFTDIKYDFDSGKVKNSADTFQFSRAFVDYYYKLMAQNTKSLQFSAKIGSFNGWCVGDAHAENFGILLQNNGSALFSMNDMDDSGPCPLAMDFFRFLVTSRLYMPSIESQTIIKSYIDGINGKTASVPAFIKSLSDDAIKSGVEINSKDLNGNLFKRKSSMSEVDSTTKVQLIQLLEGQYKAEELKVRDIVATIKASGGSAGLQRYQLLISNNIKQLIHLELKELSTPAIVSVATEIVPDQLSRMRKSLYIEHGQNYSHYYNVFNFQNKFMLLRPKFAGNIGVKLSNTSENDAKEIINYEAYILGRIHGGTVKRKDYSDALEKISHKNWEADISAVTNVFIKRFNELKNKL